MKRLKKTFIIGLVMVCAVVSMMFLGSLGPKRAENAAIPEAPPAGITDAPATEKPGEPVFPPPQDSDSALPGGDAEARTPLMATPHFAMEEYRCDCAGYCDGWPCAVEPELLEKIEALRCYFGRPVIITSGVRCEARNEEVGGVSWSFHKRGCAADLYCPGVGVGDLAAGAKDCGLNVLPYYSSGYIHVEI